MILQIFECFGIYYLIYVNINTRIDHKLFVERKNLLLSELFFLFSIFKKKIFHIEKSKEYISI